MCVSHSTQHNTCITQHSHTSIRQDQIYDVIGCIPLFIWEKAVLKTEFSLAATSFTQSAIVNGDSADTAIVEQVAACARTQLAWMHNVCVYARAHVRMITVVCVCVGFRCELLTMCTSVYSNV